MEVEPPTGGAGSASRGGPRRAPSPATASAPSSTVALAIAPAASDPPTRSAGVLRYHIRFHDTTRTTRFSPKARTVHQMQRTKYWDRDNTGQLSYGESLGVALAPKPSRPGPGRPFGSKNRRPAARHDVGKTVKREDAKKKTR